MRATGHRRLSQLLALTFVHGYSMPQYLVLGPSARPMDYRQFPWGIYVQWNLSFFKATWEIGTTWELRAATSVPRPIQYTEMDMKNKTTSELRTVFHSPVSVPNSQVPLYAVCAWLCHSIPCIRFPSNVYIWYLYDHIAARGYGIWRLYTHMPYRIVVVSSFYYDRSTGDNRGRGRGGGDGSWADHGDFFIETFIFYRRLQHAWSILMFTSEKQVERCGRSVVGTPQHDRWNKRKHHAVMNQIVN